MCVFSFYGRKLSPDVGLSKRGKISGGSENLPFEFLVPMELWSLWGVGPDF